MENPKLWSNLILRVRHHRLGLEGEERKRLDERKHRRAKGLRWSGREEVSWSEVQKVKNSLPSA